MNPAFRDAMRKAFMIGTDALHDEITFDFDNPLNIIGKPGEIVRLPALKPAGYIAVVGFVSTGSEWAIVVQGNSNKEQTLPNHTLELVEWRKRHIG